MVVVEAVYPAGPQIFGEEEGSWAHNLIGEILWGSKWVARNFVGPPKTFVLGMDSVVVTCMGLWCVWIRFVMEYRKLLAGQAKKDEGDATPSTSSSLQATAKEGKTPPPPSYTD